MWHATNFREDRISHEILVNLYLFVFIICFRRLRDALLEPDVVVE